MYKPGPNKYVPPSSKKSEPIVELKEADFPELIPNITKTVKMSYASIINPKEAPKPVEHVTAEEGNSIEEKKPRKLRVVDMPDSPYSDDDIIPYVYDFTNYYKRQNKRLQENMRVKRLYEDVSDEESVVAEDNISEVYSSDNDEDNNDNLEEYNVFEFDRHR